MRPLPVLSSLILAIAIAGCGKDSGKASARSLDGDDVEMLFPSAGTGSSFQLGAKDPNDCSSFEIADNVQNFAAMAATDGPLHFWNLRCYDFIYSNGDIGTTSRLYIHASGGTQQFTWKTQHGYLSSPDDLKNQEFTAFVRVHDISDPDHAQVSMKIRGGSHKSSNPDLASCVMMTVGPDNHGRAARFGKELSHPDYDYVKLKPKFDYALTDGAWVGIKMISWNASGQPQRVVNQLYLDTNPFDASGRPRNHWRLFSEYEDVDGVSTGSYSTVADWGGWETTVRVDGVHDVDFALVGVREISPPAAQ